MNHRKKGPRLCLFLECEHCDKVFPGKGFQEPGIIFTDHAFHEITLFLNDRVDPLFKSPLGYQLEDLHPAVLPDSMDPVGAFGVKGLGEGTTCPVPAAVAQAIYNATGIRFNRVPITPEMILNALKDLRREDTG